MFSASYGRPATCRNRPLQPQHHLGHDVVLDLIGARVDRSLAVVVDDVVTTGTTLRAVLDALDGHGVLAVSLAAA